jgi:murein DD-endopeptidase MepM/ murein hydrolase activator NlpD
LTALAIGAAAPAVATAPPSTGGAAISAPQTVAPITPPTDAPAVADQPLTGPMLSPVVADQRSTPGLAAAVTARRVYVAGAAPATLNVTNTDTTAVAFSVALVRASDSTVVRRWATQPVAPGATQPIVWDGTVGRSAPAKPARFQFQVWAAPPADTALAAQLSPTPLLADSVQLRPFAYPLDGRHDYGIGGHGRFGTGRSGHAHQGQDVFARCGTPVLAARGGTVQFAEFQSSAGHYAVIDGDGTDQDTAYMHLRDAALPAEGEHVATGQVIGYVGDTGDASECHLHFEVWDAPGWYEGGQPVDPLALLKSWDR